MDDDDDNDTFLTKNEDYNSNGSPADDDTNGNGVADYLEANVTLSLDKLSLSMVKVFPNPVSDLIFVESKNDIKSYRIYNLLGKVVLEGKFMRKKEAVEINTKSILQGTYILELKSELASYRRKIIKI